MKKNCLLIILSIFTFTSALAQLKPSIGIKAGLNFSDYEAGDDLDFESNTGFHAGIVVHILLGEKFGIQPEAFYLSEGTKEDIRDIELDFDFITVPVLVTYKILPGLRAQLGPQFRVNINTEADLDNGLFTLDDEQELEEAFEDLNFDAVAGLEFKFPVIGVFVQARYNFGLNDLEDDLELDTQSFQLSAGYRF